jgi:hypothetical protein
MSFSDNIIRSKDGNWQIVIDEDAECAHIRCTGNVPTSVKDAVEQRECNGKCNSAKELRFFARLLVINA